MVPGGRRAPLGDASTPSGTRCDATGDRFPPPRWPFLAGFASKPPSSAHSARGRPPRPRPARQCGAAAGGDARARHGGAGVTGPAPPPPGVAMAAARPPLPPMSSRGAAAPRGGAVCSSQQDGGGGGCSGGGERRGGAPSGPAAAPGPAAPPAPRARPHRLLRDRADHRQGQLRRRQAGHPPGDPGQGEGGGRGPRGAQDPPAGPSGRPPGGGRRGWARRGVGPALPGGARAEAERPGGGEGGDAAWREGPRRQPGPRRAGSSGPPEPRGAAQRGAAVRRCLPAGASLAGSASASPRPSVRKGNTAAAAAIFSVAPRSLLLHVPARAAGGKPGGFSRGVKIRNGSGTGDGKAAGSGEASAKSRWPLRLPCPGLPGEHLGGAAEGGREGGVGSWRSLSPGQFQELRCIEPVA